jgi:hypothetical protein
MNSIHLHQRVATLLLLAMTSVMSACGASVTPANTSSIAETLPNHMVRLSAKASDSELTVTPQAAVAPSPFPNDAPATFTLGSTAESLGKLSSTDYMTKQLGWVGSAIPACNFFLITALCEAGYCRRSKPFYKAADFDQYFIAEHWDTIDLESLRIKAIAHQPMDVVFQKHGVDSSQPGHVMILVGYNSETQQFVVAEGSLGTVTNEVQEVDDRFLTDWNGGFRIFIRQPTPATATVNP